MKETKRFSTSDWCNSFDVTFKGEEGMGAVTHTHTHAHTHTHKHTHTGIDWGGLTRELFQLLCNQCFNCSNGMFHRFKDDPQALVSETETSHKILIFVKTGLEATCTYRYILYMNRACIYLKTTTWSH